MARPQKAFSLSSPHGRPWLTVAPSRQTVCRKKLLHNDFTDKEHHIWNAVGINTLQTKAWSNNTDTLPLDTLCSVLLTTGPVSSLVFLQARLCRLACRSVCLKKFIWKLWLVNTDVIFTVRYPNPTHCVTATLLTVIKMAKRGDSSLTTPEVGLTSETLHFQLHLGLFLKVWSCTLVFIQFFFQAVFSYFLLFLSSTSFGFRLLKMLYIDWLCFVHLLSGKAFEMPCCWPGCPSDHLDVVAEWTSLLDPTKLLKGQENWLQKTDIDLIYWTSQVATRSRLSFCARLSSSSLFSLFLPGSLCSVNSAHFNTSPIMQLLCHAKI